MKPEVSPVVTGYIHDLRPNLGTDVQYTLQLDQQEIPLNELIGTQIKLVHTGRKHCVYCGRETNKLFANGSCYPCFRDLPQNDLCIVKPHECHYETCRDQAWGDANCMIPTYLYIAKSSDIKVGITKNVPGRWMEQGAVEAIPVALLPTRKMAGELEYFLSQHMPDKTNWRKMLQGQVVESSLLEAREKVRELVPPEYRAYLLDDEAVRTFQYPAPPLEKLASHNFDKEPVVEGTLLGMKGNYLILSTGVLNVPKFTGYQVEVHVQAAQGGAA